MFKNFKKATLAKFVKSMYPVLPTARLKKTGTARCTTYACAMRATLAVLAKIISQYPLQMEKKLVLTTPAVVMANATRFQVFARVRYNNNESEFS
jgi:hypothetical protein